MIHVLAHALTTHLHFLTMSHIVLVSLTLCRTSSSLIMSTQLIGRPFIKRFAPCYRTVVLSWCIVAKWLDGSRWNMACR